MPTTTTILSAIAPAAADGLAHLDFAPGDGRTRLAASLTRPPLGVQRSLYLDPALPGQAWVFLLNPTAGLFAGDCLDVKVHVAPGAQVHLTTQAATRVHTMPRGEAYQATRLEAAPGALLEYLPDETILYAGARLRQECDIIAHPGATIMVGDITVPGRTAMGEQFTFEQLTYRLTAWTPAGVPLFHEAFTLEPGARWPLRPGVLRPGDGETVGTLLVLGATGPDLTATVRDALAAHSVRSGASVLAGGAGLIVKLLAPDAAAAQGALRAAWAALRPALVGASAPESRKY